LFDEEQVQQIYDRVSPAVAEVNVDRKVGNSLVQVGVGSGFLIDRDGYIATNNHVVEDADRVRVGFPNGATAEAIVLGRNPANDLALIKVDAQKVAGITPVSLGNSEAVRPGQLAVAIGNPFGLDGSITAGIISGINRDLPSELGRSIPGVLQTDALINPGNSGGPLLNSSGQVVGVNTAIQVNPVEIPSSLVQGRRSIGFAVPVNTLRDLLPRLREARVIQPAWLGISATTLDPTLVERFKLPVDRGVYLVQTLPNSPAAAAGLVAGGLDARGNPNPGGDIVVAIDGKDVETVAGLVSVLNRHLPGSQITLTVVRKGAEMSISVTLGEWPAGQVRKFQVPGETDPNGEFDSPNDPRGNSIPGLPLPPLFPGNPNK